jgi:2-oxoglutarate dehydrogenase E2 component (dihydrolipoamide succinyltransferase)
MIRRRIAQQLVQAQHTAALLTTFSEIDMTVVIGLRQEFREVFQQRYGVKLGLMSFFVKAVIDALEQFPQVNAEVRDEEIVYRSYYDIGIAIWRRQGPGRARTS